MLGTGWSGCSDCSDTIRVPGSSTHQGYSHVLYPWISPTFFAPDARTASAAHV